MIAYIQGTVFEIREKSLIILTSSGIGYEIYTPEPIIRTLLEGSSLSLYTKFVVKEESQDLYGFLEKEEKDFFSLLCTVSGVGPRSALGIISLSPIPHTAAAIKKGEVAFLTRVSGIGKKAGEKIILELKDKMAPYENPDATSKDLHSYTHLFDILRSLGHSDTEIRDALQKKDLSGDIAHILREVIQDLNKK